MWISPWLATRLLAASTLSGSVEVHGEEVQFVAQGDDEDGGTGIKCTEPLLDKSEQEGYVHIYRQSFYMGNTHMSG